MQYTVNEQEERTYFRVFFLLAVLTMFEVGVIYTPIPHFVRL